MIYDCFTFNNELDLLELRLHELAKVVDKHVLVESTTTFTGITKKLYYQNNQAKFDQFKHKIIHIVVDDMESAISATALPYFHAKPFQIAHIPVWSKEIHQRNAIMRGLTNCKKNDTILISDVDEIPRASSIKSLRIRKDIVGFEQSNYYYFINCQAENNWIGTKVVTYDSLSQLDPEEVRQMNPSIISKNAGWHFSFLGGSEAIKEKINAFSHQEHNNTTNMQKDFLNFNLDNALDIFNRPFKYAFVKISDSFPKYLRTHRKKFSRYMHANIQADPNTIALREEVFKVRSALYWKELELKEVQAALSRYQDLYRNSVKNNPFPYIISKIKQKLTQ